MPLWTVLAEILGVNSSRVGLPWSQILSDSVEARGSNGRKRAKDPEKNVRLATRRGSYLSIPWTILAKIL